MKVSILILLSLLVVGCNPPGHKDEPPNSLFEQGKRLGKVDMKLREASGITASVINPGMLWTHNDGRNPPEVFLIDTEAEIRMTCRLNVPNRDWEDIAIGKGPDSSKYYIYLGEIGDNQARYKAKIIYRFEEPLADKPEKIIDAIDTLVVKLEGGSRDTEALTIDPFTNDMIIISKWETPVQFYRVAWPFEGDTLIAKKTAELDMTEVTSCGISRDGKEILLRSYNAIHYWRRSDDTSLEDLVTSEPMVIPYLPEFQGEAIGWSFDGSGFYTLSESRKDRRAHLIYYKRVK